MLAFNLSKFSKQNIFVCDLCGCNVNYKQAANNCPVCNHHIFHIATWGHTPTIESPDSPNPYRRRGKPGDGMGDKMNTPGDESSDGQQSGRSGLGTRFRDNEHFPGASNFDDGIGEKDQKPHLPEETTFIDDPPVGEGANDERFVSPSDKLPDSKLDNPITPRPQGNISNQSLVRRNADPLKRVRDFLRGS